MAGASNISRLAWTIGVPLGWALAAEFVRLPGVPEHPGGASGLPTDSVFALGVTPIVAAFVLVEFTALVVPRLRALREGSARGRATLSSAARAIGVALTLFQASAVANWAAEVSASDGSIADASDGSWLLTMALLLAGLGVTLLAAEWVTRQGLLHGLVAISAAQLAGGLVGELCLRAGLTASVPLPLARFTESPPLDAGGWLATLLAVGALVAATWVVVRATTDAWSDAARCGLGDAVRRESAPTLPIPSSSVHAYAAAAAVVSAAGPLWGVNPTWWESFGATSHWAAAAARALALTGLSAAFGAALSRVLHPAAELATLAERLGETDAARTRSAAEHAWRASLPPSFAFLAIIAVAGVATPVDPLGVVLLFAIGWDLAGAIRLSRVAPRMVPVWDERRAAAVPALRSLLASHGIATEASGVAFSSLVQAFAAYSPITLLVAERDAERARRVLRRYALGDVDAGAPEEALAPPTSSATREAPRHARRPTLRGLALAGAAAVVAIGVALVPRSSDAGSPVPRASFEIVRVDDDIDPFAARQRDAADALAEVELAFESLPDGPDGEPRPHTYALTTLRPGESEHEATERLRAVLADFPLPAGARFGFETVTDHSPDPRWRVPRFIRTYVLTGASAIGAGDVVNATPVVEGGEDPLVSVKVELTPDAGRRLMEFTSAWVHRRIAILIDGRVIVVAHLISPLGATPVLSFPLPPADPAVLADEVELLAKRLRTP